MTCVAELVRQCKGCKAEKPLESFRPHNRGGRRWTCRKCEAAMVRTIKPWSSQEKKNYQRKVRRVRRGMSLTLDARRRAKAKGQPFSLNWRDIQCRIARGTCELTGIAFDLTKPHAWNAPSLDQIVPGAGYTVENTRVILYAANMMIGTWGPEIALKVADAMRAKNSYVDVRGD